MSFNPFYKFHFSPFSFLYVLHSIWRSCHRLFEELLALLVSVFHAFGWMICAIPKLLYISLIHSFFKTRQNPNNNFHSFKSIQMTFWIPTSFKSKWLLKILFIFLLPFPTHFPFSPVCFFYECFHRRVITNSANREFLRGENTKSFFPPQETWRLYFELSRGEFKLRTSSCSLINDGIKLRERKLKFSSTSQFFNSLITLQVCIHLVSEHIAYSQSLQRRADNERFIFVTFICLIIHMLRLSDSDLRQNN